MTSPSGVRYSQGKKDIGDAKNFPWEHPVPENKFWNDLSFVTGRNFLQSFSVEEVEQLPIDPESHLPKDEKLKQLLVLLHEKLAREDAAAAPQTYYDVDFKGWNTLQLGVYTMQDQLELPEAEPTLRMMVDKRKDKSNLSHLHTLASLLLKQGKYVEAEEAARPVCDWLDGLVGKNSPQALGSRRMIAQAVWRQGPSRHAEAARLFAEIKELIATMDGGRFAVYKDEELEMVEKLINDLEKEGTN